MLAYLVGIQKMDFIAKDGKHIRGVKLHFNHKDDMVEGNAASTFFINHNSSVKLPVGLRPNMEVDLSFNLRKKLDAVRLDSNSTSTQSTTQTRVRTVAAQARSAVQARSTAQAQTPTEEAQPATKTQVAHETNTGTGLTKSSMFS
jgi:hypothetical protein